MATALPTSLHSRLQQLVHRSNDMFIDSNPYVPLIDEDARRIRANTKLRDDYSLPGDDYYEPSPSTADGDVSSASASSTALTTRPARQSSSAPASSSSSALVTRPGAKPAVSSLSLMKHTPTNVPTPTWHAPWELSAVISGHLGWVRSIAFDPSNEWFATGSADRTIKIWDLAKCSAGAEGGLKLTLTGHINAVRGLAVSARHPYLFSAGEDKQVNCWDLEYNKITRKYHGHLSGVYSLALHPTLDLLVTGGRDSVARVWDIRTKHQIHVLGGHNGAVGSLLTNSVDPQIITGSYDSTIKLWDLAAGRSMQTLTHHKKGIRAMCSSTRQMCFLSGAADNIKKWQARDGKFLRNFSGHNSVVNCMAANDDGVVISGGDNGSMHFWDMDTGYCFQKTQTVVQPGSLDAEAGIFACGFDMSGSRLVTCEADKTIKIWKESAEATEDSHPIDMKSWTKECLTQKRY